MDQFFLALQALGPVEALRFSRWGYAFVNAGHIFAIALVVGGSVPLSLRLFGLWPSVPRAEIVRVLSLTAGVGLGLALLTGFVLFATRAPEYAMNPAFQIKMILVLFGGCSAVLAHMRYGWVLDRGSVWNARRIAIVSCICWIGALVSGRLTGFMSG